MVHLGLHEKLILNSEYSVFSRRISVENVPDYYSG